MEPSRAAMPSFRVLPNVILGMCLLAVITQRAEAQRATSGSPQLAGQYLVEFKSTALPADLPARVAALGGTIVDRMPDIGVVVLANMTDSAASILRVQSDVADVTTDQLMSSIRERGHAAVNILSAAPKPLSATQPETAMAFPYQWHMRAIGADGAWRAGHVGSPDVRIAVIDTGIDPTFPDLASLIDRAGSTSYCPGEDALVAQEFPGNPSWTDLPRHACVPAEGSGQPSGVMRVQ